MDNKLRALAVYLPQFHPIPENDLWWGKGFTEWRNVVKGKTIVKGQYQPHLPGELGFYDLRIPEIREQQADLAKKSGIYGFCYYHYWFNGKRLLERPLNEVLESGKPDFPFCVCWANENWSRNWDGRTKDMLMEQNYSKQDDIDHITYLCKEVFSDKRYITVDGKPVFIIYRPSLFPNIKETTETWRNEAKKYGFNDLYLVFFWSFDSGIEPMSIGFDAAAQFTPNKMGFVRKKAIASELIRKLGVFAPVRSKYLVIDYKEVVDYYKNFEFPENFTLYPCVTPMWDNYVRRREKGGMVLTNSTPEKYKEWLENICKRWKPQSEDENFVFINAWNEWAEGNHLEPCEKWGTKYLDATKEVLVKED
ncbi:glycoside hydrolase family 99-like domain-containing protein [Arcicella rosea]|uniref:Lipopolysaccharide biosynthesis protein n=1 Tax=Arcicella rosea TaxID=502909 RepID=A0A841ELW5_9BACT|nr:glycoside hydrolase family 99-like domain-containing protein [Arcicella rosea]MBB6002419.1 lipopolysaccharide biosynthesis protein [Arcicella rosea]